MPRRTVLVVNPRASAVSERGIECVAAVLCPDDVLRTERPGHATELVRAAAGEVDTVYVYSGDGGFNEALNGIDAETPLGFVPGGGASVLPRALGLPREPEAAARRLLAGESRRISVGIANGRRFGFAAGLGLDAEIVRRVDARGRRPDGRRAGNATFALLAARTLAGRRFRVPPEIDLVGHGHVAFLLAANGDPYTYAGRMPLRLAPLARFDGGLDVVAPRSVRPLDVGRFAWYAVRGRGQDRAADIVYLHDVDRAEARMARPMPLQVDGEDLGDVTELVLESERDAVAVLT